MNIVMFYITTCTRPPKINFVVGLRMYPCILRIFFNVGIHIIGQPQTNSSIHYGGDVTLTVTATGPQPLSYQWMKDGVVISPDVIPDCIGTDTALLHITTFLPHHEGQYHCKISSENAPSLDSDPAELKIN